MAGKKEAKTNSSQSMLITAAAVLIVLAAAFFYFSQKATEQPAPVQLAQNQLETASAKLLLASFEKGAALEEYLLNYTTDENGAETRYEVSSDGINSWVRESADFGSREGFFGKDNATDVLCLKYGGRRVCAQAGNDSDMASIAVDLKTLLPNKETFMKQQENLRKHIAAGAIKFESEPVSEKLGQFDTRKITYSLDYRALTVQQLIGIGVQPNDPGITSITDQKVTYWIDKKSGLIVKSAAAWRQNLIPNSYQTAYDTVSETPQVPAKPDSVLETRAFVRFYAESVQDYQAKLICLSQPQPDQDLCFKSIAAQRNDWELCKKISGKKEYETCTVIVAQNTNNDVLCGKLELLSDDCYIAVASKTGNFELCKLLKNQSLGENCTQAAAEGKRAAEEKDLLTKKKFENANCKIDTDCRLAGSASQYCVPKNTTGTFANETSPVVACLRGVPCMCDEGYCGFAKDDPYYACVSRIEDRMLREYIAALANSTNSNS